MSLFGMMLTNETVERCPQAVNKKRRENILKSLFYAILSIEEKWDALVLWLSCYLVFAGSVIAVEDSEKGFVTAGLIAILVIAGIAGWIFMLLLKASASLDDDVN